jgi:hypothetical protein
MRRFRLSGPSAESVSFNFFMILVRLAQAAPVAHRFARPAARGGEYALCEGGAPTISDPREATSPGLRGDFDPAPRLPAPAPVGACCACGACCGACREGTTGGAWSVRETNEPTGDPGRVTGVGEPVALSRAAGLSASSPTHTRPRGRAQGRRQRGRPVDWRAGVLLAREAEVAHRLGRELLEGGRPCGASRAGRLCGTARAGRLRERRKDLRRHARRARLGLGVYHRRGGPASADGRPHVFRDE